MKVYSGLKLRKILEENHFTLVRQKVSHIILQKRIEDLTIIFPIPLHKEIRIGTLISIIRQSQLDNNLFK